MKRGSRTLAQQLGALKSAYPHARVRFSRGELLCHLELQPTPLSSTYSVEIRYRLGSRPQITVPGGLEVPPGSYLPHVFPGERLCLCYPNQWDSGLLIAHTTVPWTMEWLLYYELWKITGEWLGGGHEPTTKQEN